MTALAKRPLDLISSLPLDVSEGAGSARKKLRRIAKCGNLASRHDELVDALGIEAPRTGELLSRCLQPVYEPNESDGEASGGGRQPAAGPANSESEKGRNLHSVTNNLTSVAVSPPTCPAMPERPPPCPGMHETSPRPSPGPSARRALVAPTRAEALPPRASR